MQYTYQVVCPECSEESSHTRDTPYVRPRLHKMCPKCKSEQDDDSDFKGVVDCGALQTKQGCYNCTNFIPLDGGTGWGECQLGHVYDSENLDEYDDPLDLTYGLDSCQDWDPEGEGDGKD